MPGPGAAGPSRRARQRCPRDPATRPRPARCPSRPSSPAWAGREREFAEPLARYVLYAGPGRSVPCAAGRIDGRDDEEGTATREPGRRLIASNRRARRDYTILKTYEAGIVLIGNEVKSLRAGRAALVDGFAQVKDGEVWLINVHIPEYHMGTWTNHAARRSRKLLLHRKEINKLIAKTKESGHTLVPLSLYFKDGKAKVEIGLARGKKTWDKRHDLATRDAQRDIERALSQHLKGRRRG